MAAWHQEQQRALGDRCGCFAPRAAASLWAREDRLRAKEIIVGSPQSGTPMMQAAPLVALDLPLKVLVSADGDQTKLSHTAPAERAARYDLSDELVARLAGIDAVTDAALDG